MPWQRYVLDVALEHDGNGNLYYQTVVLEVPRQSGKTAIVLAYILMRMQAWTGQNVVYTAQDLNHARKKWRKDHCKRIRKVKGFREGADYKIRNVNGDESIDFPKTEGWYGISATGEASGHGDTLHAHMCDEAFYHRDQRVDQSFLPPMLTVENPQQWIASAAGDWKSLYFNEKIAMGKAAVEADLADGLCAFLWEAPPGSDIFDRALWWRVMPALGFTQTESRIARFAASMEPEEFARAFLCITKKKNSGGDEALDLEMWEKQVVPGPDVTGRLVLGLAMPPSRTHGALGIAGRRPEGDFYVEHTHTRSGTGWVVAEVKDFMARVPQVAGVAIDSGGPAASEIAPLEAAGVTVFKLNASKHADAAGLFYDRLSEGQLWHLSGTPLDGAVEGATKRPLGDRWAFDRRTPDVDIAPLEAVTVALGVLVALPDEAPPVDFAEMYAERGGLFSWE